MFTNKHVVVAMLVAPVLAVLAWFAVDYFVAERPHAAQPGEMYRLIAKSNCRYASGRCDLENGDFKLSLQGTDIDASGLTLTLQSAFPLEQAAVGFIGAGSAAAPTPMAATGTSALDWSAALSIPQDVESAIGIAVQSGGTNYFAEVPTTFLELER